MPTFTPPTGPGLPAYIEGKRDPANRLFSFFGYWEMGKTVWKDSQGVWHESTHPYQGGATSTVHDGDSTIVTGPDEGLATAEVVYLGGHVYDITQDEANELIAAGYGENIEP